MLFLWITEYFCTLNYGLTSSSALKSVFHSHWKWHFTLTPHSNYITLFIPFWNQFSNCNYLVDDWTYVCICTSSQIHHHLPPPPAHKQCYPASTLIEQLHSCFNCSVLLPHTASHREIMLMVQSFALWIESPRASVPGYHSKYVSLIGMSNELDLYCGTQF